MRVTLLASADFAVPTLEGLLAAGHEIAVGTQPARRAGRGRGVRPTAIGRCCDELGLAARQLEDVNEIDSLEWLTGGQPDLIVVVAFGQKLGPAVRAAAPWGCINIHPSLLPRWRGAAPVQAALLAGDETTGVCIIDVVERMDAGAVLSRKTTGTERKTAGELLEELAEAGAGLLLEVINQMAAGDVERAKQDDRSVTRAPKLTADDGRIRWEHTPGGVDRRVRAVTPRPGAFALADDGQRLRILAGEPLAAQRGFLPGEVIESSDEGVVVACGQGAYRITRLQRAGGKPMDAGAFLRGAPLPIGTRLGP